MYEHILTDVTEFCPSCGGVQSGGARPGGGGMLDVGDVQQWTNVLCVRGAQKATGDSAVRKRIGMEW